MAKTAPSIPLPGSQSTVPADPSNYLEIPYFLPIWTERPKGRNIPFATRIDNPDVVEINFRTPRGQLGDFTIQGWWAWYAIPNPDPATAPLYPLIWVEPDGGTLSAQLPLSSGPPQFVGAQEGNRLEYNLQFASGQHVVINDIHSHTNYMLVPLSLNPQSIQPEANGVLTITRRDCTRFFPFINEQENGSVYLFFGLYGKVRYNIPPAYRDTSNLKPVNPFEILGSEFQVPTTEGIDNISPSTRTQLNLNKNQPGLLSQLRYAGAEHIFIRLGWQAGLAGMSGEPVPARIFNRKISGGVLPQKMTLVAPTVVDIEALQPMIVENQAPANGRFTVGGSYFGY